MNGGGSAAVKKNKFCIVVSVRYLATSQRILDWRVFFGPLRNPILWGSRGAASTLANITQRSHNNKHMARNKIKVTVATMPFYQIGCLFELIFPFPHHAKTLICAICAVVDKKCNLEMHLPVATNASRTSW